ncbi:hypothetical protein B0F90DRAFT_342460 [Multifurca ochricompacta]|uniref:Uncharacterized protein n=1 Tax=Multifurca ochricompacta TaxID=376703 RepID=A0AAD4QNN9_9AGAM|nr:hypothetical protein B0F90DRAFT_342460 [Multifurca ochricompacta]
MGSQAMLARPSIQRSKAHSKSPMSPNTTAINPQQPCITPLPLTPSAAHAPPPSSNASSTFTLYSRPVHLREASLALSRHRRINLSSPHLFRALPDRSNKPLPLSTRLLWMSTIQPWTFVHFHSTGPLESPKPFRDYRLTEQQRPKRLRLYLKSYRKMMSWRTYMVHPSDFHRSTRHSPTSARTST